MFEESSRRANEAKNVLCSDYEFDAGELFNLKSLRKFRSVKSLDSMELLLVDKQS